MLHLGHKKEMEDGENDENDPMSIFRHYDSEFGSYTDRQFQHPRGQGESLNCQISYDKLGFFKCQHGYIHSQEHLDKQMNAPLDIFREAPEEFLTNGKNNFYICLL